LGAVNKIQTSLSRSGKKNFKAICRQNDGRVIKQRVAAIRAASWGNRKEKTNQEKKV